MQDAYAAALERDTLPAYEDFLGAYPDDPMAKRVRAIAAARREAVTWRRTYRADTPNAYWSYLQRYPRGPHAADARRRLSILTAPLEPPQAFDVLDYDVPPPPPEELIYIDRPVLAFGDPEFDFVAPPPAPVYYLPPPPDDFVILEPPPPPIGLFILPQPFFVPIPVYVRPPRYVAPPPNNIIFANIHNRAVINSVINRPPPAAAPVGGPGGRPGDKGGGRAGLQAGVVAPGQGGATPALPPAVAQRATLIQQGRAPMPPSAAINPAARTGLPWRGAGRTAERAAAGQCARRAAAEPGLAEDQRIAGSRRQGHSARAAERRGSAGLRQSEQQACAGREASRRALQAPGRRSGLWPPARRLARARGSWRRHPAPPRHRGRPRRLRQDRSRSPNFDARRHRPPCRGEDPATGGPHRAVRATAADGCATAEDGRPAAADGGPVAAPKDGCTTSAADGGAATPNGRPAARMAAPPPRIAAPPPRAAPGRSCPPGARC